MFIGEGKVADIKITQSMIDAYRAMPGNSLLTDSAIVALIEQGIEDNADWVRSLANSTKFLNNNTSSTNLFGFGFTDNTDYGWGFEKTTQQPTQVCSTNSQNSITPNEVVSSINPTPYETQQTVITNPLYTYAISFLKSISEPASSMVEERDMEGGFNSDLVNWFIERGKNEEFGRTNVKSEISKLQSDIKFLELAAKSEAKQFSVLRGYYNVTFEEAFNQTRGVEFDQNAITLCDITANNYSQVKTCYEMINYAKSKLEYVTRGDITSNLELDKAGKAIIETFKLCGAQSIEDINKTLSDISEKYKNHPTVQKYGGEFRFAKNKDGKYVLYRTDKQGYPSEAPIEELRLIAKEMELRLNQTFATMTGVEFDENASNEEMNALANDIFNDFKSTYEEAFAAAYGGKDVKILAEQYVTKQQECLATLQTIDTMISIGLMVGPSLVLGAGKLVGAGATALNATKVAKGAEVLTAIGSGWAKAQKIYSLPIMANMIIRPTELVEQWSSENKWSPEEISNYWKNTAINVGFMATGMASARIAANIGGLAKTSSLINKLKASGKSIDDLTSLIKTSPQNLPAEFVEIFTKADMIGRCWQIPIEVVIDAGSTALLRMATGSELTATDVLMSTLFAMSGGTVQNQVAKVSEDGTLFLKKFNDFSVEQKINSLKETFGISHASAMNILKTLDAATDGTLKPIETAPKTQVETPKSLEDTVKDQILKIDFVKDYADNSKFSNLLLDSIYNIVTKDGANDINVINKRLQKLDFDFVIKYRKMENALFLLENKELVNEIHTNILEIFSWNADAIIEGINKDNLHKVLIASRKVNTGDADAIQYLNFVQYSCMEKTKINISNEPVSIDTNIILHLLSSRQYDGELNFNHEIEKLFISTTDTIDKKGYGKSLTGILLQRPELLDIVKELNGKSPDEADAIINAYCEKYPTLTFNKFTPGATMEAGTATGAFLYMKAHPEDAIYKPEDFRPISEASPKIEEIKLLEGEELDAKIREVQQKLDEFDLSYLNIKLNEYNVMILDKILSNNILSENPNIEYFLRDFIKHIEDENSINICNKIFSNKTLYSDNKIIANLNIILKSLTKNGYTLIDNILSNPNALNKIELYNLKDISIRCLYAEKDVFDTILNFCLNKKVIDSSTDWLKTFEELINSFGVINMAHNKNFKFELLNDFINNPNLCNSKNLNKLTKIFPQIETAKSLSLARKFLECQNEIAIEKISKNISEFFKLSEEEVNRLLKDETENNLIYISKDNKVNSILPKLEVESSVGLRFIDGILQNIFKQKPDFEFDVKKFKEYCNTVDINKLTEIAPNIKSFSNDELTVFMLYHFLKNNTSFSKESLSFPKDLTEFLSKNHMDAENLTYLLSIFPCTNRNIGSLPQGWLKEETSKTISDTIQKTIEDFTVSKDCDTFASALTNILGKKTKITELGSGQYGITYKISVDGCEDVVIKVFTTKSQETETGSCAEIQLGPFLNIHSNDYAHFYCGKITGMQNNDGYMLTQFLSGDTIPVEHVVQTQKYKILCHDNEGDRNTIQGKIFDFGFIEVIKP